MGYPLHSGRPNMLGSPETSFTPHMLRSGPQDFRLPNEGATRGRRVATASQPSPSGLIASQSQDSFQSQGAGAVLPAGHIPHGAKPNRQRLARALKDRPGQSQWFNGRRPSTSATRFPTSRLWQPLHTVDTETHLASEAETNTRGMLYRSKTDPRTPPGIGGSPPRRLTLLIGPT
jgi:hypothetical protein